MKIFIERFKSLRKQKKLTQKQLGENINTPERVIRGYEIGENMPSIETFIKIADFFNVSIDYLVGRTDNPKGENL